MNFLLQDLFALGAILSSLLVITSKNPVISVLFLISVFVNSAVYLILLGVSFVGISYVIIYVGAIAILFLFILMMINIKLTDILEVGRDYTKNLPLALVIGALFIFAIYTIIPFSFQEISFLSKATAGLNLINSFILESGLDSINDISLNPNYLGHIADAGNYLYIHILNNNLEVDALLLDIGQIEALGISLYTQSSLLLIITSLILLLAMLAPIMLSTVYKSKN